MFIGLDYKAIGAALLEEFKQQSEYGRVTGSIHHGYAYKPYYRCLAIMLGNDDFREKHLHGHFVTLDESSQILRETHPFFIAYLAAYPDTCAWHYLNMYGVWFDDTKKGNQDQPSISPLK